MPRLTAFCICHDRPRLAIASLSIKRILRSKITICTGDQQRDAIRVTGADKRKSTSLDRWMQFIDVA